MSNIKNIIFDFDGVILDSMEIRTNGFRYIFSHYEDKDVEMLLEYHNINGGLSRFNKIKYFYKEILKKEISDERILEYAEKFSVVMREKLTDKRLLIKGTLDFIKKSSNKYNLHIASGSEEKELRYLSKALEISNNFKSIQGSPTHKNIIVEKIINENNYNVEETVLIGDSINDYEAAKANNILFWGFNNLELKNLGDRYLINYEDI